MLHSFGIVPRGPMLTPRIFIVLDGQRFTVAQLGAHCKTLVFRLEDVVRSYYVLKIQYVNRPPETRNIGVAQTKIGRESGDLVLGDPQTSGRHAEILFDAGQVRVRDAGSTNGTWFDGERRAEFALEPGQWFQAGQTTIQLVAIHSGQPQLLLPAGSMMASGAAEHLEPPPMLNEPGPVMAAPSGDFAAGGPHPPMELAPERSGAHPGNHRAERGMGAEGFGVSSESPGWGAQRYGDDGAGPAGAGYGSVAAFVGAGHASGTALVDAGYGGHGAGPTGYGGAPLPVVGHLAHAAVPQAAPNHWGALQAPGAGGVRPNFQGHGGELFVTFLAGYVLTLLSVGIYAPWFYCRLTRYVLSNTTLGPTRRGIVRLEFTGRGGELFITVLVGYLLTLLTVGIYGAWFAAKLMRFFSENVVATAEDGTRYGLRFEGRGGEFFTTILVGYLLTLVTLGIYAPWFLCEFRKLVATRTLLLENERPVGHFDFEGNGGELFLMYLAGYLLTIVTLGIYLPWLSAKVMRFFAENSRVHFGGRVFAGAFYGGGSELFIVFLAGYLLTILTVGIYLPWFLVKLWKYQFNHHEYVELSPGEPWLALPYAGPEEGRFFPAH